MSFLSVEHKIELLTDKLSFSEFESQKQSRYTKGSAPGDGVVCGYATIEQKGVVLIIQNHHHMHGTMGEEHCLKIANAVNKALSLKVPIVIVFESAGLRIQVGAHAMNPVALIFNNLAKASGQVPTIAIMVGVNSGAPAYSAALMDFTIMVRSSTMFITGPKVIEKVINEKNDIQTLGGTDVHASITGLASLIAENEPDAFNIAKKLLGFLTQPSKLTLDTVNKKSKSFIRNHTTKAIDDDMYAIIENVFDENSFLEIHKQYAKNCIVGFAEINNTSVGIVANQSAVMSGAIDVNASKKMYRFLQICDAYDVPVVFLADTPGYLPGKAEEHSAILGVGARILSVLANSTNSKVTIITGKLFGGAYAAMCPKTLGADYVFAWNTAEIGIMGTEAAVHLLFAKQIEASKHDATFIQQTKDAYKTQYLSPEVAAENHLIDGIIAPAETRKIIIKCLKSLEYKASGQHKKRKIITPMG
jgi:acetyl-CoA carboxylase carboxyltransferase component